MSDTFKRELILAVLVGLVAAITAHFLRPVVRNTI
jgi:hypothetical protein